MITIDGSQGEGGGQILRTALALSLVTGEPFRIEHIRAARKTPGLLRQHLTAVEAAARISEAKTQGAEIESASLCEVFTGFGARNVPSRHVVGAVIGQVREYLASTAPVDPYLADQLMIPLALAGVGRYRAVNASLHARTNQDVIAQFLPGRIKIDPCDSGGAVFHLEGDRVGSGH